MRGNHPLNVFARNPGAVQRPFSGIPLYRDAHAVLPWTAAEKAVFALTSTRADVASLAERYAAACASLGRANRLKGAMRKIWQAKAFRYINATRKQMREAAAALATAMANPALACDQVAA